MAAKEKNVAYILSMQAGGLLHFHYREIEKLIDNGIKITIFPTKYSKGTYMPKNEWDCYVYKPWFVLMKQIKYFFTLRPSNYLGLFLEALKNDSVVEFMVACDFSDQMEKRKIRHIHCHFGDRKLFIGYFCNKILNHPLSVTIHAHELYTNSNWRMFQKALDACENIITISEYNKSILVNQFNIDEKKVKIIRLFVEAGNPNEIKILIVSQITRRKGHDILLKAVKQLQNNNIKIWIVGGEWKREKDFNIKTLSELAKKLEMSDNVIFFGQVTDEMLKIIYRSCDIFVLPSITSDRGQKEGIPVSLMEAMAFGKPVISTKHAGIPELVEEILVEENNINELANAIKLLIDKPHLRKIFGEKNRRIIEDNYSEKNLLELQDFFIHSPN